MLADLKDQPADKILVLMSMFRDDPRADKIDLGVGVYRDAEGRTPVMRAVKEAERLVWDAQTTKAYTGLAGDPAFNAAMRRLVLGDAVPEERLASIATPGGTGAVHQALELVGMATPEATVWLPDPTWPNHVSIVRHLGRPSATYRYYDTVSGRIDVEGMLEDLGRARAGDVVVLHGCCHNPTGADPDADLWAELATLAERAGLMPLVDLAYQGFGTGLDADAAGTRLLAARLPEVLIAASCSKNFGVYRERTGILVAVAPDAATAALAQGNLAHLNRQNYSFPPDHGARVVQTVLDTPDLRADWEAELDGVRETVIGLREQLAGELRQRTNSDRFDFLARQNGMFSRLGLDSGAVTALRETHGIYLVGDSRMNVAGLNAGTVPILAAAIADVAT
jgi:aromatic-amino-acid transaminase